MGCQGYHRAWFVCDVTTLLSMKSHQGSKHVSISLYYYIMGPNVCTDCTSYVCFLKGTGTLYMTEMSAILMQCLAR